MFDPLFCQCMVFYFVHHFAKPIKGSQSVSDSAWTKLQNMLKQARAINGQERPAQDFAADYEPALMGVRY